MPRVLEILGYYTQENKVDIDFCGGGGIHTDTFGQTPAYMVGGIIDLPGNADGTSFSYNDQSQYTDYTWGGTGFTMTASRHVTAVKLGAPGTCSSHAAPIDAGDPVINDLQVTMDVDKDTITPNKGNTLAPPDPATLTVKVTCGGVAVKNAQVNVTVKPQDNSGGHVHTNNAIPRPRGFLKAPGATAYTRLTEQQPSLTVQTDGKGLIKLPFLPGRDALTGGAANCAGDQRGIAGVYNVTANLVDPRFSTHQAQRAVNVRRTDFVALPAGNHYFRKYNSSIHPAGTWGTQPTMDGMQAVADAFYDYQVQHNHTLTEAGKAAWPIVQLGLIDISMQYGGLFDTGGTNVCAGGTQSGFVPWQIPHQTHLNGVGVDISTNEVTWPGSAAKRNWWKAALRGLGCFYGTWAHESTLHLNVDQNSANWGTHHNGCQFALPSLGVAAGVTPPYAATAGPNLFVTVLPGGVGDDTYETPTVAPGQFVTFTVAVNNLAANGDAHQVVLTATLPAGMQFVSADPPASRMGSPNQPIWDVGTLGTQASLQTFDVQARVLTGTVPGTLLTIGAQASASDAAPGEDDHFSQSLQVRALGPDLTVQAEGLEEAAMTLNQPVSFTAEIGNLGTGGAANTRLTLTLPPSVTLLSALPLTSTATPGMVTWNLGTLAPGTASQVAITLNTDIGLFIGRFLTYTLAVTTTNADLDPTNNSATIAKQTTFAGSDVAVWMDTDAPDAGTLSAGQDITYSLHYGNFGNQLAPTTTLSLSLASGLSLIGAQPAPSRVTTDTNFGGGVLGWDAGALQVGDSGTLRVRVHVNSMGQDGSLTVAQINSAGPDIDGSNNAAIDLRVLPGGGSGSGSVGVYLPLVMH
jgi:uncharacterized repeat protein (TIGR01451 family)